MVRVKKNAFTLILLLLFTSNLICVTALQEPKEISQIQEALHFQRDHPIGLSSSYYIMNASQVTGSTTIGAPYPRMVSHRLASGYTYRNITVSVSHQPIDGSDYRLSATLGWFDDANNQHKWQTVHSDPLNQSQTRSKVSFTVDLSLLPMQRLYVYPTVHDSGYVIKYKYIFWGAPNHNSYIVYNGQAEYLPEGPPIVSVISPESKTYATTLVLLTFTVNQAVSWMGYTLDEEANVTITGNTTLPGLLEGTHNVKVYSNNTAGDMGVSNTIYFTIDTMTPAVQVISPENKTYVTTNVPLTFTVNEPTSWIGYCLDGQTNITVSSNITLAGLSAGIHTLIVHANDSVGNMGESETVHFTIDTTPPNITDVTQDPPTNVLPEDEVKIKATVTDVTSGVKHVFLNYTHTNSTGSWNKVVNMTNLEGNIWNVTIHPFPYCNNVTYIIIAEDEVGNTITTIEMGYGYQYHVIPEFPSFLILPLFMIATPLAVIIYRRKHST